MASQTQITISLPNSVSESLKLKAKRAGVPVKNFVVNLISKEVKEEYPVYEMSERSKRRLKEALKNRDKAVKVDNIEEFFKNL